MMQLAKVIALLAVSPALSALIGLWNLLVAMIVLIIATIFFIWIGIKIMKMLSDIIQKGSDVFV